MVALIQEILVRLERMESGMNEKLAALRQEMNDRFDHLKSEIGRVPSREHCSGREAAHVDRRHERRLDYQLSRVVKSEEEIFLLKRAGKLRFDPT